MHDYNQKYYNFIYDQIKGLKRPLSTFIELHKQLIDVSTHYNIHPINIIEFEHAFEWAIADVFGGGCEVELP